MQAHRPFTLPLLASVLLAGCASTHLPPSVNEIATPLPAQWQATQPHNGQLQDLRNWWQQFQDPLLLELIDAAQKVSPTLSAARSQIEQARSNRVAAGAALLPQANFSASSARAVARSNTAPATTSQAALGFGNAQLPYWDLDLFSGNRATRDAAQERLAGSQAQWHDARVAVAAEVAGEYLNWRTCSMLELVLAQDSLSRNATARLTHISSSAGFAPQSNAALAQAGAAQARSSLASQHAQCELSVKNLVALTAIDEPALRLRLAPVALPSGLQADATGALPLTSATIAALVLPQPQSLAIDSLPAQVIAQRPDVFRAERELMAARAEVAATYATKLPQVTLGGSIGRINVLSRGATSNADTWSVGPLSLNLPLWDWGQHNAAIAAATARYDDAASSYLARVRGAVKEVEQALVNLQSAGARNGDAFIAATGYLSSVQAAEQRYHAGLGSLVELEDTRRVALQAEQALLGLQLERANAWIALYRAAGGGWQRPEATANSSATAAPTTP